MDFIGLGTLVLTALPLAGQLLTYARRRSQYEALEKTFETQSMRLATLAEKAKTETSEWNQILQLLEISDVIMPQVIERFWRRFAILVAVAILSAVVYFTPFVENHGMTRQLVIDGLGVLGNLALPYAKFLRTNLFDSEERKFLANVSHLHDLFYDHTVIGVIRTFNERCANIRRVKIQESKLKQDFEELAKTLTSIPALQLPAASKKDATPDGSLPAPDAAKVGPKDGGHNG